MTALFTLGRSSAAMCGVRQQGNRHVLGFVSFSCHSLSEVQELKVKTLQQETGIFFNFLHFYVCAADKFLASAFSAALLNNCPGVIVLVII